MITAMPRIAIAVSDFAAAVDTFRDAFGMPVLDFSDSTVPALGAHVGMCVPPGGSNIELMAPATPDAPLAASLQKFLDRRGEGLYALMLEAPDPDAEADVLAERGIDVLPLMRGAGGRDLHPRSTHGVLIRVYPDNSVAESGPHELRPPHLSGIESVIIATTDARKAATAYERGLGLTVGEVDDDADRGVATATVTPPKGGRIELVSAIDTSRPFAGLIDDHVTQRGQGMFALVLQAADPSAAAGVLGGRGVDFTETDGLGLEASVHGARVLINQRAH